MALRPTYVRVFYDWAQADGALDRRAEGCLRDELPCGAYGGLTAQLRAIAGQALRDPGRFRPVLTIYGVPDRYATGPRPCERAGTTARSRTLTSAGLAAYRRLLTRILALARREGAAITWVSPWNEPNHPFFISPQRAACTATAKSLAPGAYARIVRAARTALAAAPAPRPRLLLGEFAGYLAPTPRTSAIGEMVGALPDDVACAASAWAVHQYVRPDGRSPDAVGALEAALEGRRCTARTPVWVTETGAGIRVPGEGPGRTEPDAGCRALAARLTAWDDDPRVGAVFQYSFREDPTFPAGLMDTALRHERPAYALWRAWAAAEPSGPPPALPKTCR